MLLTRGQALRAICLDFRGYGSQPMLFCGVLNTIHGGRMAIKRERGRDGLWISPGPGQRMRWLAGPELVEFMCRSILKADFDIDDLVRLCRQVFQTPCFRDDSAGADGPGIRIDASMTGFMCRRCGRCCVQLKYHDGITADDVKRFSKLGRDDILKWVGTTRNRDGETVYRIWIEPGTNRYAARCPFLKQGATNHQLICSIHDVKPAVCRHYPISRKHADMTGCPGFD